MSSTTVKHSDLLSDPIGEKPVTDLPGIGPKLGARLEENGFKKVYNVIGQFLVLYKDEKQFKEWLQDACGANVKQQEDCYVFLRDWCFQNM